MYAQGVHWQDIPADEQQVVFTRLRREADKVFSIWPDGRSTDEVHERMCNFWKARPNQFPRAGYREYQPGKRVSIPVSSFDGPEREEGIIDFVLMHLVYDHRLKRWFPELCDCIVVLPDGKFRRIRAKDIQFVLRSRKKGPGNETTRAGRAA